MRLLKVSDHNLINPCRPRRPRLGGPAQLGSLRLDQFSKHCSPGFESMLQAEHGVGNRPSIRSRQTHNPNPTSTRRSCDGDDGVVEVHEKDCSEIERRHPATECTDTPGSPMRSIRGIRGQFLGNCLGSRPPCLPVILRRHNYKPSPAFALALSLQVIMIAQRKMTNAA